VQKGGYVWKPDDRSDGIFFLQTGQIAIVSSDPDGRELVLGVVEAGEPACGSNRFAGQPRRISSNGSDESPACYSYDG
jgi:CRP-like cAMP-binding protein